MQKLIRSTVDFNGVGQLTSEGTISWSDFSKFDSVGLNTPISSPHRTKSDVLNDEAFNGIDRLMPFSDDTGFWVRDFGGDTWRWHIGSNEKTRIAHHEHFKEFVGLAKSEHYAVYDGWSYKLTLKDPEGGIISTLLADVGVGFIKGYPNPSLLIVEDNGDVSEPDRIYRALDSEIKEILVTETNEIFDIIDAEDGGILASFPERGLIARLEEGGQSVYATGLIEPTQMFRTDSHLYTISADALVVTRIDEDGYKESIRVSDYLNFTDFPPAGSRVFTVLGDDTMILAVDGFINRMSATALDWAAHPEH